MYLYQPCLLTLALLIWAFESFGRKERIVRILLLFIILTVSEMELTSSRISVYPASLVLPWACIAGKVERINWAEVLTAAFLGGLACWKMADAFPLSPGLMPLCAAMMLIPVLFLCRDRDDRMLGCAVGSMFFELFFCLREYMLFSFCVIRIGSRDALTLETLSMCLCTLTERLYFASLSRIKRLFVK